MMSKHISIISKTFNLGVGILLAGLFVACNAKETESKTETQIASDQPALSTTQVQSLQPEYALSVPAELKPYEQVSLHAKVAGFVKRLHVDRGDLVRKGQLLAELEAPEMEQQYLSDKATEQKIYADFRYAKQAYDRLSEAAQIAGAVADLELERARSRMESAKSAYEASKAGSAHSAQLREYLQITAPFDGIITERNISSGALVGTSSPNPLLRIAQSNKLRLTISLPEKHASSVRPGMKAQFTVSSQPGKTFDAVLSRTSGLLDDSHRSLTLEFDVDNPDNQLPGGDYAQVQLRLQRKSATLWVPAESLLQTQSGTYILTVQDGSVHRVPVQEGIRLDSLTEVFGQFSSEDQVLSKPSEEINEGPVGQSS